MHNLLTDTYIYVFTLAFCVHCIVQSNETVVPIKSTELLKDSLVSQEGLCSFVARNIQVLKHSTVTRLLPKLEKYITTKYSSKFRGRQRENWWKTYSCMLQMILRWKGR